MPAIKQIGIVLAGGRSVRMGRDKAALRINGLTLLERSRLLLHTIGCDRVLMSGTNRPDWPEGPQSVVHDNTPGLGPVSGLVSAINWASMQSADSATLIFIPVDTPLLSEEILQHLINQSRGFDGCYVSGSPLPLVINLTQATCDQARRAAPALALAQAWSIKRFVKPLCMNIISIDEISLKDLTNVNTPEQLESVIHEITPGYRAHPFSNFRF
ncbi:MAG: hypothetical protein RL651_1616 [Pseudomonadota bacterium]